MRFEPGGGEGATGRVDDGPTDAAPRICVITNDFPPRFGGINDYVDRFVRRFPRGSVTVFASSHPGWREHDRTYPQEVIRIPTSMMLPTPGVRKQVHDLLRERRPDLVLFGATWPLGHMGPGIRRRLDIPYAGFTQGLELTAALVPGLLRPIGAGASLLTSGSEWTRGRLEPAFGLWGRMPVLTSGVDVDNFHPAVSDAAVRERHGLGDDPVICCVSRLVPRKGQDMLIRALPAVKREIPRAKLLIVGAGPHEGALRRMAGTATRDGSVIFAGSVPYLDLPGYFRAGDVFAMPCRARWFGLDVEALGAVFLQGAAVGRPVVVGNSGGAPEAVQHGKTGLLVDPRSVREIAGALTALLSDPVQSAAMGSAGADWIRGEHTWDIRAARLRGLIRDALASSRPSVWTQRSPPPQVSRPRS
ncbi:MAG: glycosyltransferase family 4 protein [Gemmatimonadota bacterium]